MAKPPKGATATVAAAAGVVRREVMRRFGSGGRLGADEPVSVDGEPARRFEGVAGGRAIAVVVTVHAGLSWTLTLSRPAEGFSPKPLDDAVESWRWDEAG